MVLKTKKETLNAYDIVVRPRDGAAQASFTVYTDETKAETIRDEIKDILVSGDDENANED